MNKLLEVKEFDSITCNENYKNEYAYLPEQTFHDLEDFIHSYEADEEKADALDFLKIGYRRHIGTTISVKNYVGLIQMQNGYQVQVLPKISFAEEKDVNNVETKRVFLRMLRSMKDFPSKVFNDANLKMDRMNLYEIFINMYLQEVHQLVKHGIKSTYVAKEDNLNYYKGKLIVGEHVKRNIAHKEKFFVAYDEYHVNRAENRLVKATLLKLQQISNSLENQKTIRQLLTHFEIVDESSNYEKDFAQVVKDRNTKDYEMLIRWSKVFLLNKSFTTFSGSTNARALLFPMEKVFESYVAQELKRSVQSEGWTVSVQDKGHYLFDTPRRFALRPDIVLTRGDGSAVIMDTKWKSLVDNPNKNYGISQADMYQIYAYSKKYGTSEIWLLYPVNDQMRDHDIISYLSDDNVIVNLFFVDVANISESLNELKEALI
ncbi:McrC family protein [Hornefia butyriciproducens]|uniref:Restriction endonuclease n=1 Tax=Hornefia butyriciproducens TaxID=2652293 RepID=A0A6L5Y7W1_9FIRM|nr:restriction endonuclease [Hornefia butyriciproducens]